MAESDNNNIINDNGIVVTAYDIAGVRFRAYYDSEHNLICIVDDTINAYKPNVLLVMNNVGERKWDDVLATDYNIDLETVRPKKDNKYQKLDIEYGGLGVYAGLIHAYEDGQDLDAGIGKLQDFYKNVARRVASERLDKAQVTAENARETIDKAQKSIYDLRVQFRQVRADLVEYRQDIGKENTKKSAAKILRAEARLDTLNEKIDRARKRLASAEKRAAAAEHDAQVARQLLEILDSDTVPMITNNENNEENAPNVTALLGGVVNAPRPGVLMDNTKVEQKAEKMAEEDVKPLFDKDPEIMDDEIAFKPVDFEEKSEDENVDKEAEVEVAPELSDVQPEYKEEETVVESYNDTTNDANDKNVTFSVEETPAPAPLQFSDNSGADSDFGPISDIPSMQSVLDSMRTIDASAEVEEPGTQTTETVVVEEQKVVENNVQPDAEHKDVYVSPAAPVGRPAPIYGVSDATNNSDFRPVSTVSGETVMDDNGGVYQTPKSKAIYYLLLILLIVLSVFALWRYQQGAVDNVPELATTVSDKVADVDEDAAVVPNDVFMGAQNDVAESVSVAVPEPDVAEPSPEPEPVAAEPSPDVTPVQEPVPEPEPVVATAEPEVVPVDTDENVADESDADVSIVSGVTTESDELQVDIYANPIPEPDAAPVADNVVTSDADDNGDDTDDGVAMIPVTSPFVAEEKPAAAEHIEQPVKVISLANKPEYGVSNNKMFTSYDPEEIAYQRGEDYDDMPVFNEVRYDVPQPQPVASYQDSAIQKVTSVLTCQDGRMPDANGCCNGEIFTDMENGTFACCQPFAGGECFEPLQ